MPKLKNTDKVRKYLQQKIVATIQTDIKKLVERDLERMLNQQVDAKGAALPHKAESTKRSYKYHGWNTEDWFIRTGESAKIKSKKIKNGISVYPADPMKVLAKYVKRSEDWIALSPDIQDEILKTISKKLGR